MKGEEVGITHYTERHIKIKMPMQLNSILYCVCVCVYLYIQLFVYFSVFTYNVFHHTSHLRTVKGKLYDRIDSRMIDNQIN